MRQKGSEEPIEEAEEALGGRGVARMAHARAKEAGRSPLRGETSRLERPW